MSWWHRCLTRWCQQETHLAFLWLHPVWRSLLPDAPGWAEVGRQPAQPEGQRWVAGVGSPTSLVPSWHTSSLIPPSSHTWERANTIHKVWAQCRANLREETLSENKLTEQVFPYASASTALSAVNGSNWGARAKLAAHTWVTQLQFRIRRNPLDRYESICSRRIDHNAFQKNHNCIKLQPSTWMLRGWEILGNHTPLFKMMRSSSAEVIQELIFKILQILE